MYGRKDSTHTHKNSGWRHGMLPAVSMCNLWNRQACRVCVCVCASFPGLSVSVDNSKARQNRQGRQAKLHSCHILQREWRWDSLSLNPSSFRENSSCNSTFPQQAHLRDSHLTDILFSPCPLPLSSSGASGDSSSSLETGLDRQPWFCAGTLHTHPHPSSLLIKRQTLLHWAMDGSVGDV